MGTHPQESALAQAGYRSAGLQRGHPGHRLVRNHQPGSGSLDHGLHPPGSLGRSIRWRLDDDALFFKREGAGWPRLDKLFGGELEQVLHPFQEAMREAA